MTPTCPRAKSNMTPCYLKDGKLALSIDDHCVGCDWFVRAIKLDRKKREEEKRG